MAGLIVKFNVGGTIFQTRYSTIEKYPESTLAKMLDRKFIDIDDSQGCFFIDRDPKIFRIILNAMRTGQVIFNEEKEEEINEQFEYFNLPFKATKSDFSRKEILEKVCETNGRQVSFPAYAIICDIALSNIRIDPSMYYDVFKNVTFLRCNLTGIDWNYILDCNFVDCCLKNSRISSIRGKTSFERCNLTNSSVIGDQEVVFDKCELQDAKIWCKNVKFIEVTGRYVTD